MFGAVRYGDDTAPAFPVRLVPVAGIASLPESNPAARTLPVAGVRAAGGRLTAAIPPASAMPLSAGLRRLGGDEAETVSYFSGVLVSRGAPIGAGSVRRCRSGRSGP